MADIEVLSAEVRDGRVATLEVHIKGTPPRKIDRDTALNWLRGGHSLIPVSGHGHHVNRGGAIERVEVEDAEYLRTDTRPAASDEIHFPH